MKQHQLKKMEREQSKKFALVIAKIGLLILFVLLIRQPGYGQFFNPSENLRPEFDMPDLAFRGMLNYKDSTAHLSDFKGKLIILDFWGTFCEPCIRKFPLEDSLMAEFKDRLQFILVSRMRKDIIAAFLAKWNDNHLNPLGMPMITDNPDIYHYFPIGTIPSYVWLLSDGRILAETSAYFVERKVIKGVLDHLGGDLQTGFNTKR